ATAGSDRAAPAALRSALQRRFEAQLTPRPMRDPHCCDLQTARTTPPCVCELEQDRQQAGEIRPAQAPADHAPAVDQAIGSFERFPWPTSYSTVNVRIAN